MKKQGELPYLEHFLEIHLAEDTGIVSEDLREELKLLIRIFSAIDGKEDFTVAFQKLEDLEKENKELKEKNAQLDFTLSNNNKQERKFQKRLSDSHVLIDNINESYTTEIKDLNEMIDNLKNENGHLMSQLKKSEELYLKSKKNVNKLKKTIESLKDELDSKREELETSNTMSREENEQLKVLSSIKEKECQMLQQEIKNYQRENKSLNKQNLFLKQGQKNNERTGEIYKNQIEELKEEIDKLNFKLGTDVKEKEDKLHQFLEELKKAGLNSKIVDKVFKKLNEEEKPERDRSPLRISHGFPMENLIQYEDAFNQSSIFPSMNPTPKGAKSPILRLNSSLTQDYKIPFTFDEIKSTEDKKEESDFIESPPVERLSSSRTGSFPSKEEIEDKLAKAIERKTTFTLPLVKINELESENSKKSDESSQGVTLNTLLKLENFNSIIDYIEDFLKSEDNQTLFLLTSFEKEKIYKKFNKSTKKNFEAFLFAFLKVFLRHVSYLENQLGNMTKSSSYFQMKSVNYKREIGTLVEKFMEKNKNSQIMMNKAIKNNKLKTKYINKVINPDDKIDVIKKQKKDNQQKAQVSVIITEDQKKNEIFFKKNKSVNMSVIQRKTRNKRDQNEQHENGSDIQLEDSAWNKFTRLLSFTD